MVFSGKFEKAVAAITLMAVESPAVLDSVPVLPEMTAIGLDALEADAERIAGVVTRCCCCKASEELRSDLKTI